MFPPLYSTFGALQSARSVRATTGQGVNRSPAGFGTDLLYWLKTVMILRQPYPISLTDALATNHSPAGTNRDPTVAPGIRGGMKACLLHL